MVRVEVDYTPREFLDYYYFIDKKAKWDKNILSIQKLENGSIMRCSGNLDSWLKEICLLQLESLSTMEDWSASLPL